MKIRQQYMSSLKIIVIILLFETKFTPPMYNLIQGSIYQ